MQIDQAGLDFIASCEGFSATTYNDNGHPAIGFGHDIQPGETFDEPISRADAEQLLLLDLSTRYEPVVNAVIPPECTQNQYNCLCSFCYNLGPAALRQMVDHGWDQVPTQILYWDHVNHVVSPPLLARRQKELQLFQS